LRVINHPCELRQQAASDGIADESFLMPFVVAVVVVCFVEDQKSDGISRFFVRLYLMFGQ